MKTETLKKIAGICGGIGFIGAGASLVSNVIHWRRPETVNLPNQHVDEIKKIVGEVLDEKATKKT